MSGAQCDPQLDLQLNNNGQLVTSAGQVPFIVVYDQNSSSSTAMEVDNNNSHGSSSADHSNRKAMANNSNDYHETGPYMTIKNSKAKAYKAKVAPATQ